EPFHDGGERLAVRFTGGQIAEHDDLPGEGTRGRTESGPNTSFPRKWSSSQALESLNVPDARAGDYVIGKLGRWAGLVPSGRLQPVPHELLVERRLGTAWTIGVQGPVPRAVGSEHLVDQQQLPSSVVKPPLELRVGENQTLFACVRRGPSVDFQAERPQSPGDIGPDSAGHRVEGHVFIVPRLCLGGWREDRVDPVALDEPDGEADTADRARCAVLFPSAARKVSPDHALERDHPRLANQHRSTAE